MIENPTLDLLGKYTYSIVEHKVPEESIPEKTCNHCNSSLEFKVIPSHSRYEVADGGRIEAVGKYFLYLWGIKPDDSSPAKSYFMRWTTDLFLTYEDAKEEADARNEAIRKSLDE